MAEITYEIGANVPPIKIYPDKFSDHVVIVTGAGAGIGQATAILFAQQGAQVVALDIDEQRLLKLQSQVHHVGRKVVIRTCDVSDEIQVDAAIDWTIQQYNKIDVLANLAGIYPYHAISDCPSAFFHHVITTNLYSTFLLTRAVLPHMSKAGYGRIIHTSSSTVNEPTQGLGAYMASKAGVLGLVRNAAVEAGPGVTVNALMPGLTATAKILSNEHSDMMFENTVNRQSVKRRGHPSDSAHTICFVASPEASFFNGQIFYCNGGENYV